MFGEQKFLLIGVGVAALALFVLVKKNGAAADAGQVLGGAAVDLAGGAVAGVALGVGDAVGVPRTDMTECEKAIAEGRKLDASFACPAGTFIKSLF
jgi:hypothetical protein